MTTHIHSLMERVFKMKRLALLFCVLLGTTPLTYTVRTSGTKLEAPALSKSKNTKVSNASIAPLMITLENSINAITPQNSDEISSPAIKKEIFQDFNQTIVQLDTVLPTLPQPDQQKWNQAINQLIDPAKQNIKTLMMNIMKDEWNHRGKEVVQLAIGMARAGMTSAGISFAIQAAKIGTGNVATLDSNALLIMGLDAAAAFALSQYQGYLAIADSTASNMLTQAIITPSVRARSYAIAVPSLMPSLNYWMLSEGITIASRFMQDNNNALQQTLKNINVQDILFGKKIPTERAISTNISPFIHEVINNENIKQALLSVGGTVLQSALIGGLLYLAGFGYAESSMLESMGYTMLTAVAQSTVAQVANIRHSTEPGALINIVSAPISQQLFTIAGGSPQAAASAIMQSVATEVSNVIIGETAQKESGLKQMFNQAKAGIQAQSASLWSSFASGWQGLQQAFTPIGIGGHEDY